MRTMTNLREAYEQQREKLLAQWPPEMLLLFALSLSAVAHGFTYELISLTNSNVHRRSLLRKDMMREWIANDIVADITSSSIDCDMKMVEGYEHIHPDIAAMLLTESSYKRNEPGGSSAFPFVVDHALTLKTQDGNIEQSDTDILSIDLLAGLADECDRVVFTESSQHHNNSISNKILGLIRLSQLNDYDEKNIKEENQSQEEPAILVASMIALNLLESSIRYIVIRSRENNNQRDRRKDCHTGSSKSQKGAPLLSDMIHEISTISLASDLAPILRALLLPTRLGGINLRNLVSHGFLSTIERRWLSLTLVLIQTLDSLSSKRDHDDVHTFTKAASNVKCKLSLTTYEPMAREIQRGKNILLRDIHELEVQMGDFIPSSHMPLLRFSLRFLAPTTAVLNRRTPSSSIFSLTAIFTTEMCSLLEHSLRLLWCQVNNRPRDCIARPSEYYVTLDGHGQRDKHEVLVTPYLCDGKTRNQLIPAIGAETCALLSDLFTAPLLEAPNIRSAVCHGSYDEEISAELEGLVTEVTTFLDSSIKLTESAYAIVSCMDLISSSISGQAKYKSSYRPVFTYTAVAVRSLKDFLANIEQLESMCSSNVCISNSIRAMELEQPKLHEAMSPLKIDIESIKEMAFQLFSSLMKSDDEMWGIDDVYSEHQTNSALSDCVAAATLLSDASQCTKKYLKEAQERIDNLPMQSSSTKDRRILKTTTRFCSVARITCIFYTFAMYVALIAIKNELATSQSNEVMSRDDIIHAVERSRMTISTFDSYLKTNLDRSLKAIQQYLQGKTVKRILRT